MISSYTCCSCLPCVVRSMDRDMVQGMRDNEDERLGIYGNRQRLSLACVAALSLPTRVRGSCAHVPPEGTHTI